MIDDNDINVVMKKWPNASMLSAALTNCLLHALVVPRALGNVHMIFYGCGM